MKLLYKYREWKDPYISILTKNLLWFPSIKTLRIKDPNEFKNYPDYKKVPVDKRLKYYHIVSERHNPHRHPIEIIKDANDLFFNEKLNNWSTYNSTGENDGEIYGSKVGICSFSESFTLPHQWNNYSDKFSGFCVGFDLDKLRQFLGGYGGLIRYVPELDHPAPTFEIMEDIFITHCTKLDTYIAEGEHRYLKLDPSLLFNGEYHDKGYTIPKECYKEIIIGHNLVSKEEILNVIKNRFPNCDKFITRVKGDEVFKVPID